MSPTTDLPALVGPPALLESTPRERWLGRVRACRGRMFEEPTSRGDPPEAAVEQALGLLLMTQFVRDRRPDALPALIGMADETTHGACGSIQRATASPLLRAAFDPVGLDDTVLPALVWRAALATDLGWRDGAGRVVPLPAIALGELHQLCLSEGAAGEAGRRRAGGVHYTPVSLVDYLTGRTLGRLAFSRGDGPLRILDPSCGGGTFLLAALRWLLERHSLSPQGILDLIGASLFGIDIDPGAVAWTRRALLLAAWEAMPDAAPDDANLHVPDLSRNVACRDFLAPCGGPTAGFPEEFDAILGGPPFVRIHEMHRDAPARVERYRVEYRTARSGQFDLYMPFFEEAVRRLADGGVLGWSSSSTFLRTSAGRPLRSFLGEQCTLRELVEFEGRKVYPDAITQIVLVLLEKGRREEPCRYAWVGGDGCLRDKLAALWKGTKRADINAVELPASRFHTHDWSFGSAAERTLLERLQAAGTPLGRLPVTMGQGLVTGADAVFLLRRVGSTADGETFVQGRGRRGRHLFLESIMLRPVIRNRDITGYGRLTPRTLCVVPHDDRAWPVPEVTLLSKHPKTHRYLSGYRDALARRKGARPWHALRSAACLTLPAEPRILLKSICSGGDFTLDPDGQYLGHAGVLMLVPDVRRLDPYYLLGVLNSRVFWFFVRQTMPTMGEGRHVLRRGTLRRFPVVVSEQTREARGLVADVVRELLAGRATSREALLAEVERLVAGLYDVDPEELPSLRER